MLIKFRILRLTNKKKKQKHCNSLKNLLSNKNYRNQLRNLVRGSSMLLHLKAAWITSNSRKNYSLKTNGIAQNAKIMFSLLKKSRYIDHRLFSLFCLKDLKWQIKREVATIHRITLSQAQVRVKKLPIWYNSLLTTSISSHS